MTVIKEVPQAENESESEPTPQKTRRRKPKPTTIDASTCSILHIDQVIKESFAANMDSIPELQKDLATLSSTDDDSMRKQAETIRRRLCDLEFGFEYGYYVIKTQAILREYESVSNKVTADSFVVLDTPDIDPYRVRRDELIDDYLKIAREYINIEGERVKIKKMACSDDKCDSRDFSYEDDDSSYTCKKCGSIVEIIDESPSYKDTDRINMSSKFRYSVTGRFYETMKKYQGRQNKTILPQVIDTIMEEMSRHNISKKEVTKDHIYMFLQNNDLSNHYEDINLIHAKITGIPAPDISMYENTLMELFVQLEESYAHVKDPWRTNSMNVCYKLYKLLQKIGFPCKREDFYFLKTPAKEDEHDQKMEEVWSYLGWEWIPT